MTACKNQQRSRIPAGLWSRGMVATLGAQFLSALADNALLFAALGLVRKLHYPVWSGPLIQEFFVAAYITNKYVCLVNAIFIS